MEWQPKRNVKSLEDETFSEMQMRHAVELAKKVEQISKQFYEDGIKDRPFDLTQDVSTKEINDIVHLVASKHGVTLSEIKGSTCIRKVAWARQEAYSALRDRGIKFDAIASFFNRHHSSVITGISRHKERMK